MRISVLTIGAIASIITTAAFANQVITSQTYVDNQDALKQDKITAGTTGNVVLYNGTQNGQTQFTGRAIYDGSTTYNSSTDANKLITAGAVNTMAPELPTGNSGYAVLYDENGDIGAETSIDYWGNAWFDSEGGAMVPVDGSWDSVGSHDDELLTAGALRRNLTNTLSDRAGHGDGAIPTTNAVVAYAQPKKECVQWVNGAAHTSANCLLWNFPDGPASWWQVPVSDID